MPELDAILAELDDRAASDPRLERYRLAAGGDDALRRLPSGWQVSDAMAQLATRGGWWPGEWYFPGYGGKSNVDELDPESLTIGTDLEVRAPQVRWVFVGSVWERDVFYTPMLRKPSRTAPLLGLSNQALWTSMVFPSEACLLQAFLVTYDVLGLDEDGDINPFFVEWITGPLGPHEPDGALEVHRRLVELAAGWSTDHPCWVSGAMPRLDEEPWPAELVAAMLGVTQE